MFRIWGLGLRGCSSFLLVRSTGAPRVVVYRVSCEDWWVHIRGVLFWGTISENLARMVDSNVYREFHVRVGRVDSTF